MTNQKNECEIQAAQSRVTQDSPENLRGLCIVAPTILMIGESSMYVTDLYSQHGLDNDDLEYATRRQTVTYSKGMVTVTAKGRAHAVPSALVCCGPLSAQQIADRAWTFSLHPSQHPRANAKYVAPSEVEAQLSALVELGLVEQLPLRSTWPLYAVTDRGWKLFTGYSPTDWPGEWEQRPHADRLQRVGPKCVETLASVQVPRLLRAPLERAASRAGLSLGNYLSRAIDVGRSARGKVTLEETQMDVMRWRKSGQAGDTLAVRVAEEVADANAACTWWLTEWLVAGHRVLDDGLAELAEENREHDHAAHLVAQCMH